MGHLLSGLLVIAIHGCAVATICPSLLVTLRQYFFSFDFELGTLFPKLSR
jgi:hypothetical protein